jgi:hypothetical protein
MLWVSGQWVPIRTYRLINGGARPWERRSIYETNRTGTRPVLSSAPESYSVPSNDRTQPIKNRTQVTRHPSNQTPIKFVIHRLKSVICARLRLVQLFPIFPSFGVRHFGLALTAQIETTSISLCASKQSHFKTTRNSRPPSPPLHRSRSTGSDLLMSITCRWSRNIPIRWHPNGFILFPRAQPTNHICCLGINIVPTPPPNL